MSDTGELIREIEQMTGAIERGYHRSRLRWRITAGWWALLEAWSWTRWAWTRRPWWLFWGVAHQTPLHDPAHYRPVDIFSGFAAAIDHMHRQVAQAMAETLQPIARAVSDVAGAILAWWNNLPPDTRATLAAMSETRRR